MTIPVAVGTTKKNGAVFMPLFYGVAGFIGGALFAFLYNLVAGMFGGVIVYLET